MKWNLFLSHTGARRRTRQPPLRQLQLLVPDAPVFLDVDDLKNIGALEAYIAETQAVLIFLSKGYFGSRSCMREVYATSEARKPLVLVMEMEAVHGGAPLTELQDECAVDVREYVFGSFDAPRSIVNDIASPSTSTCRSSSS